MSASTLKRLLLILPVLVWAGGISWLGQFVGASDLAQVWHGARGVWAGQNPYDLVGPDRAFHWAYPLFYPFPAILLLTPFAWLPLPMVDTGFVMIGAGLLAWGLTRDRLDNPQLLVFASLPFFYACLMSQWGPLLIGAALIPGFAWLLPCKPTLGLALLAWRPSSMHLLLAGAFVLVSLMVWPSWPWYWFRTLEAAPHITAPVLRPWGWLLLLSAVAWRTPEARLLLALAVLPQPPLLYEGVIVFLVSHTWGQSGVLWATSLAAWIVGQMGTPETSVYTALPAAGPRMIWGVYLPATLIVLVRWTAMRGGTLTVRYRGLFNSRSH